MSFPISAFCRIACLISVVAVAPGCVSTLKVKRDGDASQYDGVPGLPFYKKQTVSYQETIYQEPRSVITAIWKAVPRNAPQTTLATGKIGPVLVLEEASALKLINDLNDIASDAELLKKDPFDEVVRKLNEHAATAAKATLDVLSKQTGPLPEEKDLRLLANRITSETQVDTTKTYYVNGRLPWIGKGESDFVLATDQTLTSAKAVVEPKVLETLLAMLPIKEKLLSRWDLVAEETTTDATSTKNAKELFAQTEQPFKLALNQPLPAGAETTLELTIERSVEPVTYRLRRHVIAPNTSVGKPLTAAQVESGDAELAEVAFGSPKKKEEDGDKKEDGKVSFSGEVQLPKAAAGEAPAGGKPE